VGSNPVISTSFAIWGLYSTVASSIGFTAEDMYFKNREHSLFPQMSIRVSSYKISVTINGQEIGSFQFD